MTDRRRRSPLRARLLLSVVASILSLLVGELGVRTMAAWTGKGFFREDRLRSSFFLTYDDPPPRIDADGRGWFRHSTHPVDRTPPPNCLRILTVGGSTTANVRAFARSGRDYAMTLEECLTAAAPGQDFEVLNAGADAFSTAHSLVNLQLRLLEFHPTAVILMHNINDLSANYFGAELLPDYANKYLEPFFIDPQLQVGRSWQGFLNQSRLLAATGIVGRFRKSRERVDVDISEGLRLFRRNLDAIARTCTEAGVRLALLSQPSRFRITDYYRLDHFTRYNQEIEATARAHDLLFVDMHQRFGHDEEFYLDEFHYSPAGIERFASQLASALTPWLLEQD